MSLVMVMMPIGRDQSTVLAAAGINKQINFQGKLTNTNGTNVANGTYNLRFRLYDATSSGTLLWTEDYVYGSGAPDNRVTVTDGIFQVPLGSLCALAGGTCGNTSGAVSFNTDNLYLTIALGNTSTAANFAASSPDPEMSPRMRFTASPYAFNSDNLQGISAGGFVQLGQSSSAQTDSSTNPGVFINKTGASGNIVELQKSGADVLTIANSGALTVQQGSATLGTSSVAGSLVVSDGSSNTGTITQASTSNNATFQLPSTAGGTFDFCTTANNCTGLGAFINNGTSLQSNANFNIQSAASGSIGGIIKGASGQSVDVFEVQNSSGTNLLAVDQNGGATIKAILNFAITAAPASAPTTAINASAGNLTGTYYYVVTYVTGSGETNFGPYSAGVSPSAQQVNLTAIPTGPAEVTARKIYRNAAAVNNSGPFLFVATINDNTTTTFTDNVADGSLGVAASYTNTTGGVFKQSGVTTLYVSPHSNGPTALGSGALTNNKNGYGNTAVGNSSLNVNVNGSYNTAFGFNALLTNTGNSNTALGALAGYTDQTFATPASLSNATSIGYSAQIQSSNAIALGQINTTGTKVAIGTTNPTNFLSVSPDNYDTGTAGTGGVNSTTVTGVGTSWTSAMVGSELIFADGTKRTITAVGSATSLTVASTVNQSAGTAYRIHLPALQVTSSGNVGIGTAAPTANLQVRTQTNTTTALLVQNSSATDVFTVDTTNSQAVLRGINSDATIGSASVDTAGGTQDFPSWSAATNWTRNANSAPHTSGNTAALVSTFTPTIGATYQVSYSYSGCTASNTLAITMGGVTLQNSTDCVGSNTKVMVATSTAALTFTPNSAYSGTVSNVIIKPVTINNSVLEVRNSSATPTLQVRSSGSSTNTFVGLQTGNANTSSGLNNTGLGSLALQGNTTGSQNSAVGSSALANNVSGAANSALGYQALLNNTTGNNNVALGYQALVTNVSGAANTALGYQALNLNTTGSNNTATGIQTLAANTTGTFNTASGYQALNANTISSNSSAFGYQALFTNTGANNTAVGTQALYSNTIGSQNNGFGYLALYNNTSGSQNTAFGYRAGYQSNVQSDFRTLNSISNSTLLGVNAQAYASNVFVFGGQGTDQVAGYGFGNGSPTNFLSVTPLQYNTGTVATTSSSGAIVGTGTTFTSAMVGSEIYIASSSASTSAYKGTISTFTDATHITVSPNVTFTIAGASYYILYTGLQVTSTGNVGVGTLAPTANLQVTTQTNTTTALLVQNASNNDVFLVDTTNGQAVLGKASTVAGKVVFNNTTNANTATLQAPTLSANVTYNLPSATTGTYDLCTTANNCSALTGYIRNGTSSQSSATFNIQTGSASNVVGVLQGAASQTADLLDVRDSTGANLTTISATGNQESLGQLDTPYGGFGPAANNMIGSTENLPAWTLTNITAVSNPVDATNPSPAGDGTADKLTATGANGTAAKQVTTTINAGTYNFSIWLKTNSGTQSVQLRIDAAGGTISPTTGTAATFTATTTWQRFNVTQTLTGSSGTSITPTIVLVSNGAIVAGWGGMLVSGFSYPPVYTPSLTGNTFGPVIGSSVRGVLGLQDGYGNTGAIQYSSGGVGNGFLQFTAAGTNNWIAQFYDATNLVTPLVVRGSGAYSYFTQGLSTPNLTVGDNSGTAASADLSFAEGANRTLNVNARAGAGTGYDLTVSAGAGNTANNTGGNLVLTGGAGVGTGAQGAVKIGAAAFTAASTQNITGSVSVTQANLDSFSTIPISANAAGYTLTVPTPGINTVGRVEYITNVGSFSFTLLSTPISPNVTATIIWNGSAWTYAGADGTSILNQSASIQTANFNIQSASTTSAGAVIQGAASQTAGLLQLRDSTGANLASFNADSSVNLNAINTPYGGFGYRENRLIYSEKFNDASWTKTNVSVTADDGASNPSPNRNATADLLTTNSSSPHTVAQTYATTTAGTYVFSMWVKTNSGTQPIQLRIDSTAGTPTSGTASSFTATTTWQRFSVSQTFTGSPTAIIPTLVISNNSISVVGWGAQMVLGSSLTPYLATSAYHVDSTSSCFTICMTKGVIANGSVAVQDALGGAADISVFSTDGSDPALNFQAVGNASQGVAVFSDGFNSVFNVGTSGGVASNFNYNLQVSGKFAVGTTVSNQAIAVVDGAVPAAAGLSNAAFGVAGTATSATETQTGLGIATTFSPSSSSSNLYYGLLSGPTTASSNLSSSSAGIGGVLASGVYTGTGTIGNLDGVNAQVYNTNTGTVTWTDGLYVFNPANIGGGTITNNAAIWINNQTAATNNYGLVVKGASTNPIKVQDGSNNDTFTIGSAGSAMFRTTTNAAAAFQVQNANSQAILTVDTTNTNLVANGGFENGTTGWTARTGCTLGTNATERNTGLYAGSCTIAGTSGAGFNFVKQLSASTQYTVSFRMKSTNTSGNISFGYAEDGSSEGLGGGKSKTDVYVGNMGGPTFANTYQTTFTTSGTVNAGAYFFIKTTDATARNLYLDDFLVQAASGQRAYEEGNINLAGSVVTPLVLRDINGNRTGGSLDIQQQTGTSVFWADANIYEVHVGGTLYTATVRVGSIDSTANLVVFDTKNTSGDPTGSNGAIYYNTGGTGGAATASGFEGKFRCYEGGLWKNCVGMRDIAERRWGYALAAGITSTSYKGVGYFDSGNNFNPDTRTSNAQAESNYATYTTSGTLSNDKGINSSSGASFVAEMTQTRWLPKLVTRLRVDASAVTNARYWTALSSAVVSTTDPTIGSAALGTSYIGMSASSAVNSSKWICGSGDGTNHSGVDTGVTMTAGHYYDLIVDLTTAGTLVCSVSDNGGAYTTVTKTTNLPTTSTSLGLQQTITNITSAAARSLSLAYTYLEQN